MMLVTGKQKKSSKINTMRAKEWVQQNYPHLTYQKVKTTKEDSYKLHVYHYIMDGEDVFTRTPVSEDNAWVQAKNIIQGKSISGCQMLLSQKEKKI